MVNSFQPGSQFVVLCLNMGMVLTTHIFRINICLDFAPLPVVREDVCQNKRRGYPFTGPTTHSTGSQENLLKIVDRNWVRFTLGSEKEQTNKMNECFD